MIDLLKSAKNLKIYDQDGTLVHEADNVVFFTDAKGVNMMQNVCWPWADIGKVEVDTGPDTEAIHDPSDEPSIFGVGGVPEATESGASDSDADGPGGPGGGAERALPDTGDAVPRVKKAVRAKNPRVGKRGVPKAKKGEEVNDV